MNKSTNSMVHDLPWMVKSFMELKGLSLCSLQPILSRMNAVHPYTSYYSMINFNIISHPHLQNSLQKFGCFLWYHKLYRSSSYPYCSGAVRVVNRLTSVAVVQPASNQALQTDTCMTCTNSWNWLNSNLSKLLTLFYFYNTVWGCTTSSEIWGWSIWPLLLVFTKQAECKKFH
jgi:hypothetical protein